MAQLRLSRKTRLATGVFAALLAVMAGLWMWPLRPPSFAQVHRNYRPSAAYLLDRHGELLDTQRVEFAVRRLEWAPLSDISVALVVAVVEAEDRRYWQHGGVDWRGVLAATLQHLTGSQRRGASTITMQLAALIDPDLSRQQGPRGIRQKLRQTRLAWGLEQSWSKQQILEAYLNLLPFRGELQGIAAAAQVLAHKSPSGLTTDESRILAALLPSPQADAERVATRACARLPFEQRAQTCSALQATASALLASDNTAPVAQRLAPHLATALLKTAGQSVRTTLDAATQRLVIAALEGQLSGLGARNVRDGAALVVDNETGDVLAYVGSGGPASRAPHVDGVRARRQAGSTLKPFLYELAIERRYLTAGSLLDDLPVNIETPSGLYLPQDYDHEYRGAVSVRTALASSLNVPAVRTLMLLGVEGFRTRLNALGYQSIDQDGAYYGYALALGAAEVSLWEQALAYRTLALGGRSSPLRLKAEDPLVVPQVVTPAGAAYIVSDMLSDRSARVVTFGLNSSLATAYWSAVKTGTSKDMRDNWCVGFTTRYTVAVWVGNFEGDAMHDVSGVTGAAPVWRQIMDSLQQNNAPQHPKVPAGIVERSLRYAQGVESPRKEWFIEGTTPTGLLQAVAAIDQQPHISSPVNGLVLALDPDMPAERQRLPIDLEGGTQGLHVKVDGQLLGRAGDSLLWQPQRGVHQFSLEDDSGRRLDGAVVTVR